MIAVQKIMAAVLVSSMYGRITSFSLKSLIAIRVTFSEKSLKMKRDSKALTQGKSTTRIDIKMRVTYQWWYRVDRIETVCRILYLHNSSCVSIAHFCIKLFLVLLTFIQKIFHTMSLDNKKGMDNFEEILKELNDNIVWLRLVLE